MWVLEKTVNILLVLLTPTSQWMAKPSFQTLFFLTLCGVAQLSTHNSSIRTIPGVITCSAPHIVHTDLYPAFVCNVAPCQS